MTTARRLAALESKLIRPAEAAPVDLTEFFADLAITLVAHHHGHKKPRESILAAYARALGVTPAKLFKLVTVKPKAFAELHLAVDTHCRDVGAVRFAVIGEFVTDEIHHRGAAGEFDELVDAFIAENGPLIRRAIELGIMRPEPPRVLCKVRPLAPPVQ
jgi:hypothetical protein